MYGWRAYIVCCARIDTPGNCSFINFMANGIWSSRIWLPVDGYLGEDIVMAYLHKLNCAYGLYSILVLYWTYELRHKLSASIVVCSKLWEWETTPCTCMFVDSDPLHAWNHSVLNLIGSICCVALLLVRLVRMIKHIYLPIYMLLTGVIYGAYVRPIGVL